MSLCDTRKAMKMGATNVEKRSLKTKHLAPIFRAELFEGDTLNEVWPREKPWFHCGGGTISCKSPCLSRVGSRVAALAAGRGNFSEKQREGGTRAAHPRRYLAWFADARRGAPAWRLNPGEPALG